MKLLKGAFSKVELQKMGTQLKEGNAKWFNHEFGLCKKGLDIKKIDDKVPYLLNVGHCGAFGTLGMGLSMKVVTT